MPQNKGWALQAAEKLNAVEGLYQGTTSVGPQMPQNKGRASAPAGCFHIDSPAVPPFTATCLAPAGSSAAGHDPGAPSKPKCGRRRSLAFGAEDRAAGVRPTSGAVGPTPGSGRPRTRSSDLGRIDSISKRNQPVLKCRHGGWSLVPGGRTGAKEGSRTLRRLSGVIMAGAFRHGTVPTQSLLR